MTEVVAASGEEKTARTTGEELFLVHLSRYKQPLPDDYDRDGAITKKERSMSAGEELWEIHCRRSQGRAAEEEEESKEQVDDDPVAADVSTTKKRRTTEGSVQTVPTPVKEEAATNATKKLRNLSLRNREIEIA
jgi:predicted ribonuclease toxin of YeeF-YezG toxin-antitoxin module